MHLWFSKEYLHNSYAKFVTNWTPTVQYLVKMYATYVPIDDDRKHARMNDMGT